MMEIKVYAPVLIPTLCRYDHFKRCIDSLSKCTHADKTELIIGIDYPLKEEHWEGYRKIDSYVDTITGFRKVTILRTDHNLGFGPKGNLARLYNYIEGKYDRWISTEDDNEFAPAFLDYMNKALEMYKDDLRVSSVCGFNQYQITNQKLVFTYDASAWGIGCWFNKTIVSNSNLAKDILQSNKQIIKILKYYPALLSTMISMIRKNSTYGDSNWTCYNIINEHFQIRPSVTLVRNWGHDGSGTHCSKSNLFISMSLPEEKTYDFSRKEAIRTKEIDKDVRRNMMPSTFSLRMRSYIKIIVNIVKIRNQIKLENK